MARIRTLKPEFWQSEALAARSPHARLLAIAVLQLADSEGRFRWIPMQVHAHAFPFEPHLDIDVLAKELEGTGYMVRYEVQGKMYAEIPSFLKHQRLSGKEAGQTSKIPQREVPGKQQGSAGEFPGKHPDAQEQGNRGTGEQGKEEQDSSPTGEEGDKAPRAPETRRPRLVIPSLEEVRTYCQDRGNRVDPEQWFDHYTSNGWMVGKSPMRDWMAAVRTWERRETNSKGSTRPRSGADILAEGCADAFAPPASGWEP